MVVIMQNAQEKANLQKTLKVNATKIMKVCANKNKLKNAGHGPSSLGSRLSVVVSE